MRERKKEKERDKSYSGHWGDVLSTLREIEYAQYGHFGAYFWLSILYNKPNMFVNPLYQCTVSEECRKTEASSRPILSGKSVIWGPLQTQVHEYPISWQPRFCHRLQSLGLKSNRLKQWWPYGVSFGYDVNMCWDASMKHIQPLDGTYLNHA